MIPMLTCEYNNPSIKFFWSVLAETPGPYDSDDARSFARGGRWERFYERTVSLRYLLGLQRLALGDSWYISYAAERLMMADCAHFHCHSMRG